MVKQMINNLKIIPFNNYSIFSSIKDDDETIESKVRRSQDLIFALKSLSLFFENINTESALVCKAAVKWLKNINQQDRFFTKKYWRSAHWTTNKGHRLFLKQLRGVCMLAEMVVVLAPFFLLQPHEHYYFSLTKNAMLTVRIAKAIAKGYAGLKQGCKTFKIGQTEKDRKKMPYRRLSCSNLSLKTSVMLWKMMSAFDPSTTTKGRSILSLGSSGLSRFKWHFCKRRRQEEKKLKIKQEKQQGKEEKVAKKKDKKRLHRCQQWTTQMKNSSIGSSIKRISEILSIFATTATFYFKISNN